MHYFTGRHIHVRCKFTDNKKSDIPFRRYVFYSEYSSIVEKEGIIIPHNITGAIFSRTIVCYL